MPHGLHDDQPSYRQGTGREWSEWCDGGGGTGVGRAGEIVVVRAVSRSMVVSIVLGFLTGVQVSWERQGGKDKRVFVSNVGSNKW